MHCTVFSFPYHVDREVEAYEEKVKQCEIDARKEHESNSDIFNSGAIKIGNACLVSGETSRSNGRKRMINGVKHIHAPYMVCCSAGNSQ